MLCAPLQRKDSDKEMQTVCLSQRQHKKMPQPICNGPDTYVLPEFSQEGRGGTAGEGRLFVYLFISSPSLFSPGKNPCQVYLQSSAWGSWELQLARSSQSGAQRLPYHRCVLLPSALRWAFSPALGEAKLRRTQEKYVLEKICSSKSIVKTLCLHCYLSFRRHYDNIFISYPLSISSCVNVHIIYRFDSEGHEHESRLTSCLKSTSFLARIPVSMFHCHLAGVKL